MGLCFLAIRLLLARSLTGTDLVAASAWHFLIGGALLAGMAAVGIGLVLGSLWLVLRRPDRLRQAGPKPLTPRTGEGR
jgi:hypothetical protein